MREAPLYRIRRTLVDHSIDFRKSHLILAEDPRLLQVLSCSPASWSTGNFSLHAALDKTSFCKWIVEDVDRVSQG